MDQEAKPVLAIWCPNGKGADARITLNGHDLGRLARKVTLEITRDRARVILDLDGRALEIQAESLVAVEVEPPPEPRE